MNRRTLLAGGGCIGLASLSGCLGTVDSLLEGNPDVDRRDPSSAPRPPSWMQSDGLDRNATAETAVQFGSTANTHWVYLTAASTRSLETHVTVRRKGADRFYTETVSLSHASYVVLGFGQPSTYVVDLSVAGETATVEVPEDFVDCNDSSQLVVVRSDGTVEKSSQTTQVECGPL
ncbi:hypothetical protein [Halohasta litorea]|uniref:Lipoprotein n=1 Tax=Halohasta litorea TaxID=869891 RepID=A0ABD6D7X4_9EURY|nr:hypothetical protein [Halohasta litorea]